MRGGADGDVGWSIMDCVIDYLMAEISRTRIPQHGWQGDALMRDGGKFPVNLLYFNPHILTGFQGCQVVLRIARFQFNRRPERL